MFKKMRLWAFLAMGIALVSGCATTRNYQPDIDSLNSKISTLEGQLSSKDQEISRLQSQLSQTETEKRALSDKLDQLEAAKRSAVKPQESDLK